MNLPPIYERFCKTCKKRTLQRVSKANRLKGIKFTCLECGIESKRYSKLNEGAPQNEKIQ